MTIIDYSGITISAIFVQNLQNDLSEDLLRHYTLNSIRMYNKKFRDKFGPDIYIACDHSSWRKRVYEYYKANRKTGRDKSDLDWDTIYGWLNKIKDEIDQFTPYYVVSSYGAEADDVIAILVEQTREFGKSEDVMIVSSDKDFLQLQKYPNVHQFSSIRKKFLVEPDPKKYLFEHIVRGDGGDGVPNIFSDDDTFVTDKRQHPVYKAKLDKLYESWLTSGEPDFENETHKRNFHRNQKMIDLSKIPDDVVKDVELVIEQKRAQGKVSGTVMMNYLIKRRCQKLLEALPDFF